MRLPLFIIVIKINPYKLFYYSTSLILKINKKFNLLIKIFASDIHLWCNKRVITRFNQSIHGWKYKQILSAWWLSVINSNKTNKYSNTQVRHVIANCSLITINKMSKIPSITLNNGKTIPVLGLGTWQVSYNFFIRNNSLTNIQSYNSIYLGSTRKRTWSKTSSFGCNRLGLQALWLCPHLW